jgi:cell division protein FtsL
MAKLPYIINSLSLLVCLVSCWKIFSIQSENQALRDELFKVNVQIKETTVAVDEAKKGQVDKLAREQRKNNELEEQEDASKSELDDLLRKRDQLKVELENSEMQSQELAAGLQKVKVELAGVDREIETSRQNARTFSLKVPALQAEIVNLENQISQEEQRKQDLDEKISSYDTETKILKKHYDLTISALQKDFYERPWLERGERVTIAYSSLDLNAGILMLPIGKDHGLEQKMRFSVRAAGVRICQVSIKEVAFDHCVAMIVPLYGNPSKLKEFKQLDLIYL